MGVTKKLIILFFIVFMQPIHATETTIREKSDIKMITERNQMKSITSEKIWLLMSEDELSWPLVLAQSGLHNEKTVTLLRFQPNEKLKWFTANTSILLDENDRLQGFTRLQPKYNENLTQVSSSDAERSMISFISKYAPELKTNYKIQWIGTHDEDIMIDGTLVKVRGMKVKCRDLDTGLYFWTVVAPDSSVMTFEKEVKWDFIRSGRQTQKWLHDEWAEKHIN